MTVGERIKARRLEINMTQSQLAKLVGYSNRSTITLIETNQRDISRTKVIEIAKALRTTPAYIMGWDGSENTNAKIWENMTKQYDFTNDELEQIIDFAKYLISKRDK